MSNPPAVLNEQDELSGGNPGQDVSQPDQYLAADSAASSGSSTSGDSDSSTSGGAVCGLPKGGATVTPPDGGYPPS